MVFLTLTIGDSLRFIILGIVFFTTIFFKNTVLAKSEPFRESDIYKYQICFVEKDLPLDLLKGKPPAFSYFINRTGKDFVLYRKQKLQTFRIPEKLDKRHLPILTNFKSHSFSPILTPLWRHNHFKYGVNFLAPSYSQLRVGKIYHSLKEKTISLDELPLKILLPLTFYEGEKYYEPQIQLELIKSKDTAGNIDIISQKLIGDFPDKFYVSLIKMRNIPPNLLSIYESFRLKYDGDLNLLFVRKFKMNLKHSEIIKSAGEILYMADGEGRCNSFNGSYHINPTKYRWFRGSPGEFSDEFEILPYGYTNTGSEFVEIQCSINLSEFDISFDTLPKSLQLKDVPEQVVIPEDEFGNVKYKLGKKIGNIRIVRKYRFNKDWKSLKDFEEAQRIISEYERGEGFLSTIGRLFSIMFNLKLENKKKEEMERILRRPNYNIKIIQSKSNLHDNELRCFDTDYFQ